MGADEFSVGGSTALVIQEGGQRPGKGKKEKKEERGEMDKIKGNERKREERKKGKERRKKKERPVERKGWREWKGRKGGR